MVTEETRFLEEKQNGLSIEAKKGGAPWWKCIEREGLYFLSFLRRVWQVICCDLASKG